MPIENVLSTSRERIASGLLRNEAQVKSAIIIPILRALGWDDSDPTQYVPEYALESTEGSIKFVDIALLGPRGPLVFIEAKRLGGADDKGVEQVFGYASNRGIPFLVLTDGNVWDFYVSMAAGIPAERRFYRLELQRDDRASDHSRFLQNYLQKGNVGLSETLRNAHELLDGDRQKQAARDAIPMVWQVLISNLDQSLCSLIADAVEGECGTQPDLDDVEKFLPSLLSSTTPADRTSRSPIPPVPSPNSPDIPSRQSNEATTSTKIVGFVMDGKSVEPGKGNRTLAEVLKVCQERDSSFMPRYASKTAGSTRRLVSQTRDGLYDLVHLRDYAFYMENGWWLGTNISSSMVRKYIRTACETAGIEFGSQLTLVER